MGRTVDFLKNRIVKFKLEHFFWIAPIHYGMLLLGYFNVLCAIVSLIATANDSYSPMLKRVQELILEDDANLVTACIVAYCTDLAFAIVLIIGMHRRDLVLLRTCMYATLVTAALTFFLYLAIIMKIDALLTVHMFLIIAYDCYYIVLIRSVIVMFGEQKKQKELKKNGDLEVGEKAQEQEPTTEVNKEDTRVKKLEAVSETDEESSE